MLDHVDLGALKPEEQKVIDALKLQLRHVEVIKEEDGARAPDGAGLRS